MSELFKLNRDGTVAVDTKVRYYKMDSCPLGCTVQLHSLGGINTRGIVKTTEDAKNYQGWRPVPAGALDVEEN